MTEDERKNFLYSAELEYCWLLEKLGYPNPDLSAFFLTAELAKYLNEMCSLWRVAHDR